MSTRLMSVVFALCLLAVPICAAEAGASSQVSAGDIQQVLDRLQGSSGLHGANASEMAQFTEMINTPEMAQIVSRLSEQLQAQGGNAENMDMKSVADFVAQNLTRADAEALLGVSVTDQEFREAVVTGNSQENLDALLEMLQGKK